MDRRCITTCGSAQWRKLPILKSYQRLDEKRIEWKTNDGKFIKSIENVGNFFNENCIFLKSSSKLHYQRYQNHSARRISLTPNLSTNCSVMHLLVYEIMYGLCNEAPKKTDLYIQLEYVQIHAINVCEK